MESFLQIANSAWAIWLEAAAWLLFGIIAAGLLKVWMPTRLLQRWLGGRGILPPLKAAVIGTPLPLCSCSVLPAAVQLHRSGASKGATVSFLIATPENGADSLAVSYVLLGPVMTVVRVVAALVSAVTAGVLTEWLFRLGKAKPSPSLTMADGGDCCTSRCCGPQASSQADDQQNRSTLAGLRYAFTDLLGDIAVWLSLGILLAAVIHTFMPPSVMAEWGSGLWAMLAILLVSVPMYICATASTPVAASLLLSGMSPGTVLVFLLAGPATNFSSAGIVKRELGGRALMSYLVGVIGVSLALGLSLDWLLMISGITILAQQADVTEIVPEWLAMASAIVLGLLMVRLLLSRILVRATRLFRLASPRPLVNAPILEENQS